MTCRMCSRAVTLHRHDADFLLCRQCRLMLPPVKRMPFSTGPVFHLPKYNERYHKELQVRL